MADFRIYAWFVGLHFNCEKCVHVPYQEQIQTSTAKFTLESACRVVSIYKGQPHSKANQQIEKVSPIFTLNIKLYIVEINNDF